ncbi:MAG: DNA repair protein RadA [Oscillospiraceae bacterium]|nr:DNA repair protein RadA [Oscillospiraceae bacterium]
MGAQAELRFSTGLSELDRVLGGGAVEGSLVLVGGAPGIGKSTLLLQICDVVSSQKRVLYVTGEESERQLKMRADRLGVGGSDMLILAERDLGAIIETVLSTETQVLIVDSVQTVYSDENTSAPGSVSQVKDCTMALMQLAKSNSITVFLIGHVNKEGAIAGPKVLEHMVDCVLYFEGDQSTDYRILRAVKNRFGSTNELGVFEMRNNGLIQVPNPSQILLDGRPENAPGMCVTCVIEGSRPILAEIQALVTPSSFNVPRRNTNGVDYNRSMMLLAVLEKRSGYRVNSCDAYLNVIGGLYLNDTGADLAVILALASSYKDKPIDDQLVAVGEVGLTGELRTVNQTESRLAEIARLGFKACIIPAQAKGKIKIPQGLQIFTAKTLYDAIKIAFGN